MNKVISMCEKTNNGRLRSPEDALNGVLNYLKKIDVSEKPSKVLILILDDNQGNYGITFEQSGMKLSECISMCEIAKTIFLTEMEYIYSGD